jgi:Cyclin D1 binding domain
VISIRYCSYGGSHGTQVINITYSGDEMIATKCTGDRNVPRGEVTFTANLEPRNTSALPPIQLISEQRKGEFRRFPGKGQVSRRGFKDHRYVEGQLILFENQFSFVWIPTKHHVSSDGGIHPSGDGCPVRLTCQTILSIVSPTGPISSTEPGNDIETAPKHHQQGR